MQYPFQSDILADHEAGRKEATKQLVVSPTGSGKTNMFVWLAQKFIAQGLRVLVLVDQDSLVWQTVERFQSVAGITPDVEKADYSASHSAQVVVGSVQTMYRKARLERWPPDHFGLVIADEADRSISDSWQTVLRYFDVHAEVCGFTATPWRADQRNLGCYYQRKIEKETLGSLIVKGYLSPIRVERLPVKLDLSSVHLKDGDYDKDELDEMLKPHLEKIAKEIQVRGQYRKSVVFLPLVKTAQTFAAICRDLGMDAESISGEDPDRKEKWERFKANGDCVMANAMLLNRGVDDPKIDCIVPCRPTKSKSLYFQQVGRGTRLAKGKDYLLLLDFLYQSGNHLVCRPWNLIAKDEFEAEQMEEMVDASAGLPSDVAQQLDLVEMAATASSQREEALRKRLEALKSNRLEVISPEEFALLHHSMDLAEYQPVMPSDAELPTAKQMDWIKKARVNPKNGKILMKWAPGSWKPFDMSQIKTRGQASKTLDLIFKNEFRGAIMASPAQRAAMERMGYGDTSHCTASEARAFFASRRGNRQQREMAY